jgi:hypothetical protein
MDATIQLISNVKNAIKELEEHALSGNESEHLAFAEIKSENLDELLKESLSKIQSNAIEILRGNYLEHNQKSVKADGFKFTVRAGSTRYYYTGIEEIENAKNELKNSEAQKKVKDLEAKYKVAFQQKQKGVAMFDEETGEEIDVSLVNVVHSKDGLTVKPV